MYLVACCKIVSEMGTLVPAWDVHTFNDQEAALLKVDKLKEDSHITQIYLTKVLDVHFKTWTQETLSNASVGPPDTKMQT